MSNQQICLTPEVLAAIGIDPQSIRDQVVDAIVSRAMGNYVTMGPDGETGWASESNLSRQIHKQLEAAAAEKFGEVVKPISAEMLETLTFPQTNTWGEPKGAAKTLREWLDERARTYLTERVDRNGKAHWEGGHGAETIRIVYLLNEHLRWTLQTAVDKMLTEANQQIAGGLEAAVKESLQDVLKKLKVSVKTS